MRNIDLIRQVISASENNWPHVLGCLNINVPDSPRRHAPCPACGGKDRFRFDDNGRGSFICNQCGAGDGLDLIKRVNNCDTTEAALLAADVLGIDYRTTETPEATSQKREQLETERQRREQERLKRAEKDEQQRRDTFSRQFDDMRRKAVNGKSDYLVAKGVGDFTFPVLPDGSLLLALVDKADPEGAAAFAAAAGINTNAKKLMSVRENDDGTVTKYYTDGSEEQGKLNQPISGDGFRPIALPTAQKIMEKSPEGAKKAAGFAYRVRDALDSIDTLKDQLSPQRVAVINNALGNGTLANLTLSPTEQQYVVNANDAIMAILRQETGAAIVPAEMSKYYQMYFPQPGDSTKTIDTKRRKMENQFNSLKAASGRAYDALRVISAVDRGTSSSSQTLPQSEQVSQPAASSNFSSLWGD